MRRKKKKKVATKCGKATKIMFLLQDESFLIEYIQAGQSERVWRTCIILNHELFYGGLRLWEGNERENYRGNRRKRNFIAFGDNLRRKMLEVMLLMKRKKAQGANNSISCMNSHQLYAGRKKLEEKREGRHIPQVRNSFQNGSCGAVRSVGLKLSVVFSMFPKFLSQNSTP